MPAAISWVLSHVAEPMDVRRRPEELARRLADAGTLTAVNVAAAGDPVAVGMIPRRRRASDGAGAGRAPPPSGQQLYPSKSKSCPPLRG